MRCVNSIVAVVLLLFALLLRDEPTQAAMFIVGATLAAVAFKRWLSLHFVRGLAVVATGALFWYFAQFLYLVPNLQPDWYRDWGGEGMRTVGLLFAGFAMIPVLSEYSCRMKASGECERARRQFQERKSPLSIRRSQPS